MANDRATFGDRIDAMIVDTLVIAAVQVPVLIGAVQVNLHGVNWTLQKAVWVAFGMVWPAGMLLASALGPWRTPGRRWLRIDRDPAGGRFALVRVGERRGVFLRRLVGFPAVGSAILVAGLSWGWLFYVGVGLEGQTARAHGSLTALRSAIGSYAGEHGGRPPVRLDDAGFLKDFTGGTLTAVGVGCLGHPESNAVETYPFLDAKGNVDPAKLKDTGHWLYDAKTGTLIIDCTHPSPAWPRADAIWRWE